MRETLENPETTKPAEKEPDLYVEDALELAGMSRREKIAYKRKLQKERLASMDKQEKRRYIIHYYKWHFIIGIFAICCLAWIVRVAYRATFPTVLSVVILNTEYSAELESYITDSYREYCHLDNKNVIDIYSNMSVSSTEDTTESGTVMTDYQKIGFYNMSDMVDVIIGDEEALTLYASSDDTTAIDLSMDEELYDSIKDHVITMSDPKGEKNDGRPYAAAIDISDTDFAKNCGLSYDEVYLMIPSTKYTDNEGTLNLIKMIFGL